MAPGIKTWGWAAAAVIAAVFLAVLAFFGDRPEPGLVRFEPAGLLVDWPIEEIATLELSAATKHRSFHRGAGGWSGEGTPPDLEQRIAIGLKLLHNSAPERILGTSEIADQGLVEFGLEPPRLTLSATTAAGRRITIHFGGANPLGLARYAQIDGRPEVILLSAFVAESWERVMEAQ